MSQIAYVGNGIFVGNYRACDDTDRDQFMKRIHIWHSAQPGHCSFNKNKKHPDHLVLEWLEGTPLNPDKLQSIYDFAAADKVSHGALLVHCAAGMARSPTVAMVCKVARDCNVFTAMSDITKGMWSDYHIKVAPQLLTKPMTSIFEWLGDRIFDDPALY